MLVNKVILITGGADGIGWECARAYARAGATVCILDRKQDDLQGLKVLGNNSLYMTADVTREDAVRVAFTEVITRFGRLDAIHNNAGNAFPCRPLHATTLWEWDNVMNVNVKSILLTTKYGIDHLKRTNGVILNTSSVVGSIGQANHAAYVASKGAVNALTKAMALDYAPYGVRVNAVSPAAVDTPMLQAWKEQQPDKENIQHYLDNLQPLGRMPGSDVIADACVFLMSDAARFITGCILPVSGGAELGYRALPQNSIVPA